MTGMTLLSGCYSDLKSYKSDFYTGFERDFDIVEVTSSNLVSPTTILLIVLKIKLAISGLLSFLEKILTKSQIRLV